VEIKKILIPIDGSKRSYNAVQYGVKFVSNFKDCSLTICHVINDEILRHLAKYRNVSVDSVNDFFQEQAELYLNKAKKYAKTENYDERLLNTIILKGDPSKEIITLAPSYDLIIMTLKSRDDENIIGHVTARVINFSKTPVLVL